MITQRTMLVLGAGASVDYGFPTGAALALEVCEHLGSNTDPLRQVLHQAGVSDELAARFSDYYRTSRCESLDSFAEQRPEYLRLVKMAVAERLIAYENDEALMPRPPNPDWYAHLLDRLLPAVPSDLLGNRLSIITLNFDRSFERRLFLEVRARYGTSDDEAGRLCQSVPVLHVHGKLGHPAWYGRAVGPDGSNAAARGYGEVWPVRVQTGQVREMMSVHEQIYPHIGGGAWLMLAGAENVCFLGFGYHKSNLEKLRIPGSLRCEHVRGTSYQMAPDKAREVESRFVRDGKTIISLHNLNALDFFCEFEDELV